MLIARLSASAPRAAVLLAVLIILASACTPPKREPVVFRYQIAARPDSLDPAHSADVYSGGVVDRMFEGLTRLDRVRGVPAPHLAATVEVDEDGLVYTFHLREGARFHNGRPVLASDVKRSWERVLDPATGSPWTWLLDAIDGAAERHAGTAAEVAGIEVEDPSLVRVRLTEPVGTFLYLLAQTGASIVPVEEVERLGAAFGEHPVGSGPFRFAGRADDVVTLEAVADHRTGAPEVDHLEFVTIADPRRALREFQAGHLDLVSELPGDSIDALKQTFAAELRVFPGAEWRGLCFACGRAPFDDVRLRRAIALAVDRGAQTRIVGPAKAGVLAGLLPETVPGFRLRPAPTVDRAEARRLLAEVAAATGGGPGVLVLTTRSNELDLALAERMAEDLAAVGLEVRLESMPAAEQISAVDDGRLDFFRFGWVGDYPDAEAYLRPLFRTGSESNYFAYSDPTVDDLLDRARREVGRAERIALLQEAEARILADAPCVPVLQVSEAVLIRDRWQGIPVGYKRTYLEIELAHLAANR